MSGVPPVFNKMCESCETAWGSGSLLYVKWGRGLCGYCEWCNLSETGLRPEAPRRPRGPPGILIRGLAAYSRRSRTCQSHTHSLTTHPHLSFHFLSQTPSLSRTHGWREHFCTSTCAEEACLIAGCGLGSVFSFILILIGLCT